MPSMLLLLICPCFCLLWVLQWWFWSHFLQGHMGKLWRHRFLNHLGDTLWMILYKAMLDSVFSKSSRKCENSWSAEWILSLTVCYSLQVVGVSRLWGSLFSFLSGVRCVAIFRTFISLAPVPEVLKVHHAIWVPKLIPSPHGKDSVHVYLFVHCLGCCEISH